MDAFAQEAAEVRAEVFNETAAKMGIGAPIIIEKDFWVCWALKRVFELEAPKASIIFKGGTSLSKAYGAIHRFSEDIDLSLDRADLGFSGETDPANENLSNNQRKALLKDLSEISADTVQGSLKAAIQSQMQSALPSMEIELLVGDDDPQTLIFNYPASLPPPPGGAYLQDKVKLEFGARSDHLPAETRTVTAYAAQEFPDVISEVDVMVNTLSIERTFWEKATVLHMLHHMPDEKDLGKNMSRHYYDMSQLASLDVRDTALGNLELLAKVADHKTRFLQPHGLNTAKLGHQR
ncbi:MAG: nucleotidyl transferase AbiEii/AbiGii toxin family protein [Pseudomonadota bacterium]